MITLLSSLLGCESADGWLRGPAPPDEAHAVATAAYAAQYAEAWAAGPPDLLYPLPSEVGPDGWVRMPAPGWREEGLVIVPHYAFPPGDLVRLTDGAIGVAMPGSPWGAWAWAADGATDDGRLFHLESDTAAFGVPPAVDGGVLQDASGSSTWTQFEIPSLGAWFDGSPNRSAGADLTGDGVSDLAVTADLQAGPGQEVAVLQGPVGATMTGTPYATLEGPQVGSMEYADFTDPVAVDLTGDGIADLGAALAPDFAVLEGPLAPGSHPGVTDSSAYISLGSGYIPLGGWSTWPPAASGDWNGDGYADVALLIYSMGEDAPSSAGETRLAVWSGPFSGYSDTSATTFRVDDAAGSTLPSVAAAWVESGDINADGVDDLLIEVAQGGPYGWEPVPVVAIGPVAGEVTAAELTPMLAAGLAGAILQTADSPGMASISSVGDVDGDGLADVTLVLAGGFGPTAVWFGPVDF